MSVQLSDWLQNHPQFTEKHIIRENKNWGKLVCKWKEVRSIDGQKTYINHVFSATVNLKTGEVFLDCRRRKIFAKNAALIVGRPLMTVVKTLYHLSQVPIIHEVYKKAIGRKIKDDKTGIKRDRTWADVGKRSIKSLADIVRTPAYGAALLTINVASLAIIPLSPNKAFGLRSLQGKVEKSLHWGKIHTAFTLGVCFQSAFNVDLAKSSRKITYTDDANTDYSDINNKYDGKISKLKNEIIEIDKQIVTKTKGNKRDKLEYKKSLLEADLKSLTEEKVLEIRMANFAQGMISDRRENYNPFYQIIGKLDPNKPYKSSNLKRFFKDEGPLPGDVEPPNVQRLLLIKNLQYYMNKINSRFKNIETEDAERKKELRGLVDAIQSNLDALEKVLTQAKTEEIGHEHLMPEEKVVIRKAKNLLKAAEGTNPTPNPILKLIPKELYEEPTSWETETIKKEDGTYENKKVKVTETLGSVFGYTFAGAFQTALEKVKPRLENETTIPEHLITEMKVQIATSFRKKMNHLAKDLGYKEPLSYITQHQAREAIKALDVILNSGEVDAILTEQLSKLLSVPKA